MTFEDLVLGEILRALVVPEEMLEMDERVLRRGPAVLGDAERGDRARVHEAAAGAFGRADHVHRSPHVEERAAQRPRVQEIQVR